MHNWKNKQIKNKKEKLQDKTKQDLPPPPPPQNKNRNNWWKAKKQGKQ